MRYLLPILLLLAFQDGKKPPAITTDGVDAVPKSVFDRLQQYQNVRAASFQDWAPDGKSLLISTRFGSTSQLHRVFEPGGRREQVTFFEEPVSDGWYLPDGTILLSMATGGSENFQLYRLDLSTGRSTLLTDGKSRYTLGAVNMARTKCVLGINKGDKNTDLFLFDPLKPEKPEPLLESKGESWHGVSWSPDDSKLVMEKYVSANESYLHVMDVASRKMTPVPIPDGVKIAAHDAVTFMGDGTSIYVASDAKGEFTTLARVDLGTMNYSWITSDIPWNVTSITMTRDYRVAAFTVNEDGASRLYIIEGDKKPKRVDMPLGIISNLSFSPDGKRLAFTHNRPDAPGDIYVLDGDGRIVRWTYSEIGGLNASTFVMPERISVESFDKRKIPAYVFKPKGAKKAPVIISIHGGPEGQFQPYFSGQTQFYLAEMGCAVIGPNVRGSTGYGKTFMALDNADKREDSVKDIGAILDWIATQPDLDATRVAVVGGSYGGYMVLASLIHFGERIKAGIDVVGIANFTSFLSNTSAYRQDLRRAEYGDERDEKMKKVFEEISPSNHVDKIKSALLVAHGKNDPRVPFSEAQLIAKKVKEAGKPVWTCFADNEGHGFAKKENRDYLTAVGVYFLNEYLLK